MPGDSGIMAPDQRRTERQPMPGNTIGEMFRVMTFGESHGLALGCIVDGCPPGLELSEADLQIDLDRRRPGQSKLVSPRMSKLAQALA